MIKTKHSTYKIDAFSLNREVLGQWTLFHIYITHSIIVDINKMLCAIQYKIKLSKTQFWAPLRLFTGKGGSRRREKNRKVLLMMMWALEPSAATAFDTTTTSQSKSSCSYLQLILWCFSPNSCPHTKFHPNRTKNIEVKKIGFWSALVGWSGRSKNSCIHF